MDHAGLIGDALFGLFIAAFALGNICYGISLFNSSKFDVILSYLLLFWGFGNLIAFANDFLQSKNLGEFVEYLSIIYQPIMRILVGLWLLHNFKLIKVEMAAANKVSY